jgi:hypothetical protein
MLKGKMYRKTFSYAARKLAFTIKTTTGAPTGTTSAGKGFCYNLYDDTWYIYSLALAAWTQIG